MHSMHPLELENIVVNLPEPIYWADIDGRLLGCNKAEAQLFGLSPQEMVGKTIYDLCDLLGCDKKIANDLNKNNIQVMTTGQAMTIEEKMQSPTTGKETIFRSHKVPLFDENNHIIGFIGSSTDITEEVAMKQALEQMKEEAQQQSQLSNIYLANILNNLPEPIYWMDKNSIILGANNAEAKLFNFKSPKEIIGKNMYDIGKSLGWNKKVADGLRKNDEEVMRTKTPKIIEESGGFLPDGKEITVISHKAPLYDEHKNVIGVIGTSIDITARKVAEENERLALIASAQAKARQKIETEIRNAVTILAGSIAHDLRAPLSTILLTGSGIKKHVPNLIRAYRLAHEANLDLAVSQKISDSQIEGLKEMCDAFETIIADMNAVIATTLKTIQDVVSGNSSLKDRLVCNSNKCIASVLDRYLMQEERALIIWDRKYSFDFMGNSIQFLRILFNLIKNALYQIKLHKKGKLFISAEADGDVNILRFRDTAGGASKKNLEHMFDAYHSNTKDGTGVGLAFCKVTMEYFGGTITCHGVEGDYIEFVLSFPKVSGSTRTLRGPL